MAETISGSGGNVEGVQEVDVLVEIGSRQAGSDAERRAARHLAGRLEGLGRETATEPSRVQPGFALTYLIHALAGIVGSVLTVYAPAPGLLLVAAAAISAFGDLTGAFHLVRRLTPTRASQNVVSDEDTGKPGLLVLVAHYDAPRGGLLTEPRLRRWPAVLFWSLAIISACGLFRLAGLGATWLTIIQFIPTVALIALCPPLIDTMIAPPRKGAGDDAAGVAAVLALAERHGGKLEHFDVMVLFTGGSAHFALGMRNWLKRHRGELDPTAVAVVSIDNVGTGTPHYAVKEGPILASRLHPTLTKLCADTESATPYISRELSDAFAARAAGLPAIRISGTPQAGAGTDDADPDALARVTDFASDLVERIDAEIGPQLA